MSSDITSYRDYNKIYTNKYTISEIKHIGILFHTKWHNKKKNELKEECYLFLKKGFIEDSMKVLEADDNILQVWLRGVDDSTLPHPWEEGVYELEGLKMVLVKYAGIWNGFSLNPGLKRLSDWKELPNGYDGCERITPSELSGGVTLECDISMEYRRRGRIAMRFLESYVTHIGWDRHIIDGVNGK